MAREHICSLCNVRRTAVVTTFSVQITGYMLFGVACTQYCLHGTLRLQDAFKWLCMSEMIEDHLLYHATVVSRCTS